MLRHERINGDIGADGVLDQLRAEMFASGEPVYILVDPLLGSPWPRPWKCEASGEELSEHVIRLSRFGLSKELCPFIVHLPRSSSFLLDESFAITLAECGDGFSRRTVCGWFSSSLDPQRIVALLLIQMHRRNSQGDWLFRFYDPRTLMHLPHVLGLDFAIAGVSRWMYVGKDSVMALARCNALQQEVTEIPPEKLSRLDMIGVVNQAYTQWQALGELLSESAFPRLFDALEIAVRAGLRLDQVADCVSFMLHRCLIHPRIEEHPVVAGWLTDARLGKRSYADSAAVSTPAVWNDIGSGQWANDLRGEQYG